MREECPSGFEAMGRPVLLDRRNAAYVFCLSMDLAIEESWRIVESMASHLAGDRPHAALQTALEARVDLTGAYRLLALLLTGPTLEEPAPLPAEATYLDLYEEREVE